MELGENFYENLCEKYNSALKDGSLIFNGESAIHEKIELVTGTTTHTFQLTQLQSLLHRPEQGIRAENPFENPEPELTVVPSFGEDGKYRIVLNKFPVVEAHFMLVTTKFESQNSPLSPSDLHSTYRILNNLKLHDCTKEWFAFYNCGPQSGASQPHKHIQFMTIPSGHCPSADVLANTSKFSIPDQSQEPLQDASLPYAHFLLRLPDDPKEVTEDVLALIFVSLLQRTLTVLKENDADHISYNFLITDKYMMLVPRSRSKFRDTLGLNSCAFMGLLLCKSSELVDLVKTEGPETILQEVGYPNTSGEESNEYNY